MKLVIGGAYQGKLAYALSLLEGEETATVADGARDGKTAAFSCAVVTNLHEYIRRLCAEEGGDGKLRALDFAARLVRENPGAVVVCNELGCGVVPIEKSDRIWREAVGEACQFLAGKSDGVYRVVCGIPVRLKGEER